MHLRLAGSDIPEFVREYQFERTRKWRVDFAWVELRLMVEIEGGIHTRGRHVRGVGYEKDLEKYNAACLRGWHVLRFSPAMVQSGVALLHTELMIGRLKRLSKRANVPLE